MPFNEDIAYTNGMDKNYQATITQAVTQALGTLEGSEKKRWHAPVTKLAWLSSERHSETPIEPQGLAKAIEMSKELSPSSHPTAWLDSWCQLRKDHPGVPRTPLNGDEVAYRADFSYLNRCELKPKDVAHLAALEEQYIGLDQGVKPEFVIREFDNRADATEYLQAVGGDTVLQENWVLEGKTDVGSVFYAASYDKEDIPSFIPLKVLQLSGVKFEPAETEKLAQDYHAWETESPSAKYWNTIVKYARFSNVTTPSEVSSRAVHSIWEMTARRDEPDRDVGR